MRKNSRACFRGVNTPAGQGGKLLTKWASTLNVNRLKKWDILMSRSNGEVVGDNACHGRRLFTGSGAAKNQGNRQMNRLVTFHMNRKLLPFLSRGPAILRKLWLRLRISCTQPPSCRRPPCGVYAARLILTTCWLNARN